MTNLIFEVANTTSLTSIVTLLNDDELGAQRESVNHVGTAYLKAFEEIQSDPNAFIIIAKLNGDIIGCAQLNILHYLTYQGGKRAQIEGVRVARGQRGQGVGKELFSYLINFAKEKGCHMVQLTTDKRRPQAANFYESLGFNKTHHGYKLFIT